MRKSRFTESQIVAVLHEGAAGANVKELCRRHGITETTYYRWKARYGVPAQPTARSRSRRGRALLSKRAKCMSDRGLHRLYGTNTADCTI